MTNKKEKASPSVFARSGGGRSLTPQSSSTKKALYTNILCLVICIAMLIGTTFAWFTDTVSSGKNTITAGNLKIQAYYQDVVASGTDGSTTYEIGSTFTRTTDGKITFGGTQNSIEDAQIINEDLWEPGKVGAKLITVKNVGSLTAKIKLSFNVQNKGLEEALWYDFVQINGDDVVGKFEKRPMNTLQSYADEVQIPLKGSGSNATSLNDSVSFILLYGMNEEADNQYQDKTFSASVDILATQYTDETDSFDNQYDINSVYPVTVYSKYIEATEEGIISKGSGLTLTDSDSGAKIEIPSGAVDEDTNATFIMTTTSSTSGSVTYQISLKNTDNISGNSIELKAPATITADIGTNLTNVEVLHSDEPMTQTTDTTVDGYTYNKTSGELKITTKTFSPFQVNYKFDGVASVNGKMYASINEAIDAAKSGATVVVEKNITYSGILINLVSETPKKITVDLNGKTLTQNGHNRAVQVAYGGADLTIKNGTINANNHGVMTFDGCTFTMKNITLNCNKSEENLGVWSSGANSKISIDKCNIKSTYFGVYQNGSNSPVTVDIKNSTIVDTYATGVYISNSSASGRERQTLTIEKCNITAPTAVEVKHTNATITNSTLTGTGTPTSSVVNGNGTCSSGYSVAVTTNSATDKVTGKVEVANCTLNNAVGSDTDRGYCFVYELASDASVTINGTAVANDGINTYNTTTQ
jgi:predicted ribosomally synthesized peptide with SipW-like signal peptide